MRITKSMLGDNRTSGMLDLQQGSIMAEASRLNSQTQWTRMSQKKNALILIACILAIGLIIAGISIVTGAGQYEINPARFNQLGSYRYPGLEWGMSVEETAYALPKKITQDETLTSGDTTGYVAEGTVKLNGQQGNMTFFFEKDKLESVTLHFTPTENAQGWYEAQIAAFTEQFGAPPEDGLWKKGNTSLQLTYITEGREPTVVLTVGY